MVGSYRVESVGFGFGDDGVDGVFFFCIWLGLVNLVFKT